MDSVVKRVATMARAEGYAVSVRELARRWRVVTGECTVRLHSVGFCSALFPFSLLAFLLPPAVVSARGRYGFLENGSDCFHLFPH